MGERVMDFAVPLLRDDDSGGVRLFDDVDEAVWLDIGDLLEKAEGKGPANHGARGEDASRFVAQALQASPYDEPHTLGHVKLVDLDIAAELAAVKELSFLHQVTEYLLDEERVSLRLVKHRADYRVRRWLAGKSFEHRRDRRPVEPLDRDAINEPVAHEPLHGGRQRARDVELHIAVGPDTEDSQFGHERSHGLDEQERRLVRPGVGGRHEILPASRAP